MVIELTLLPLLRSLFFPFIDRTHQGTSTHLFPIHHRPSAPTKAPPHHARRNTSGHLPTEVLEQIFLFACTDGGHTGCSLSLVSRHIRAVSRTARFHSISLLSRSGGALQHFLRCFEAARAVARHEGAPTPGIRHLCVASTPGSLTPSGSDCSPPQAYCGPELQLLRQCLQEKDWRERSAGAVDVYHAAVDTLLRMVAGDLETLCLFTGADQEGIREEAQAPHIGCCSFPRLRELSISGDRPDYALPVGTGPHYPAMTRLHIATNTTRNVDFRRWVSEAPRLSSLRVTSDNSVGFAEWMVSLQSIIRKPPPSFGTHSCSLTHRPSGSDRSDTTSGTYSKPRVVLLAKPNPILKALRLMEWYHVMVRSMYKILSHTDSSVVFVPYYAHQDVDRQVGDRSMHMDELLQKDWLARVSTRDGVFPDNFWWEYRGDGLADRMWTQWVHGSHYLEPLIRT